MTATPDTAAIETTRVAMGAAAIVDFWMGDKVWRHRLDDSDFLESADWMMAVELATRALVAGDGASHHCNICGGHVDLTGATQPTIEGMKL